MRSLCTLRFLLSAMLTMIFSGVWAQNDAENEKINQLTIDAQLMSRGEIREGGLSGSTEEKDDNKANFIFSRARLSIGYEREQLSVKVTARHHYLATSTKLQELDRTLGHEIELRASYRFMKDATIALGYTQMKGTETMEALKRSTDNRDG